MPYPHKLDKQETALLHLDIGLMLLKHISYKKDSTTEICPDEYLHAFNHLCIAREALMETNPPIAKLDKDCCAPYVWLHAENWIRLAQTAILPDVPETHGEMIWPEDRKSDFQACYDSLERAKYFIQCLPKKNNQPKECDYIWHTVTSHQDLLDEINQGLSIWKKDPDNILVYRTTCPECKLEKITSFIKS
jgi:hypothetical protein